MTIKTKLIRQDEGWWSPQTVATYLQVSLKTVYRLLQDGSLPSTKVRRSRRIPAVAVKELATRHTVKN